MKAVVSNIALFLVVALFLTGCGSGSGAVAKSNVTASPAPVAPTPSPDPLSATAPTHLDGPQTSWMVVTLPNPQVMPAWQSYAPADCRHHADACAEDQRFWEQWDFAQFRTAIDASFDAIHDLGKYHGVMLLMPLGDTPVFWNNLALMYEAISSRGLEFQAVVFPKQEYGPEWCYLYSDNAPSNCSRVAGTTTATAYQKLIKLMDYVENLGGACNSGQSNRPVAVWYGWATLPGYDRLSAFWNSLPTRGCNLRASYITWLDTRYSKVPEVAQLQKHVIETLHQPYWVNTELYSEAQIQTNAIRYQPYQTVITGWFGASNTDAWSDGMCGKWKVASKPVRLGVWNFGDRDVAPVEQYRAFINGAMADVNTICGQSTSD